MSKATDDLLARAEAFEYAVQEGVDCDDYHYEELICQTEKAWLFLIEEKEHWLPKSQCKIDEEDKVISIPDWLAEEKGLV